MKSLKRITWYMRPYKWIIIIGVFTVILPVAMELVVPRMLRVVIGLSGGIDSALTATIAAVVGTITAWAVLTGAEVIRTAGDMARFGGILFQDPL